MRNIHKKEDKLSGHSRETRKRGDGLRDGEQEDLGLKRLMSGVCFRSITGHEYLYIYILVSVL